MFHHDLQHTGMSPFVGSSDNTTKWKYHTGGEIAASPAIGLGVIYITSSDGNLTAVNTDGTFRWRFGIGGRPYVYSSPTIALDGTIYVGSSDGNLYAIRDDGTKGTLKWTYPTGGSIWSSPAIGTGGTIYFGSQDFNLYAITDHVTFGMLKWD